MHVRTATPAESAAVRNLLDGALLELDSRTVEEATRSDDVFVAVRQSDDGGAVVLGAAVLDESEILAIAVRRRRRGQGIGTALVEEVARRHDVIHAEFHERVRPFWESLGVDIEPVEAEDRYRGRLTTEETRANQF